MKISKRKFAEALNRAWEELKAEDSEMANYRANLELCAGRWNFWNIHCVTIDGEKFYCAPCCKTANTNIGIIRRVCAMH